MYHHLDVYRSQLYVIENQPNNFFIRFKKETNQWLALWLNSLSIRVMWAVNCNIQVGVYLKAGKWSIWLAVFHVFLPVVNVK